MSAQLQRSEAIQLRLHDDRFVLSGPADALVGVRTLYHPAVIDVGGAFDQAPAAAFLLDRLDVRWRLCVAGAAEPLGVFDDPFHALLRMEHEIEILLLARLEDRVAFHAGAVVTPDGACLLAGSADTGKSSSTLHLVELGHAFLAEEIAAIDSAGRVLPHLQSLSIDPRVTAELAAEHPICRGRIEDVDELLHRYLPTRIAQAPARLATIVLPIYRPGLSARVDQLSAESALTDLLGFCFEPPGDPEASIDRIIELAGGARLLRVSYPDAVTARALFADLFPGDPE